VLELELAMFGWTTPVLAGGIIPAFWEEANGNRRTGWKWVVKVGIRGPQ
jgi:hypothetical protein